jgi:hypothetical protein
MAWSLRVTVLVAAVVRATGSSASSIHSAPKLLLPGLPWPQALQGHDDENWPMSLTNSDGGPTPGLLARYDALAPMQPGLCQWHRLAFASLYHPCMAAVCKHL